MGKGGRISSAGLQASQLPSSALQDPRYEPFREPDFNAGKFTSDVLSGSRTTAQAASEELKAGVKHLEQELSGHIVSKHKDLLQHARKLSSTERSLQDIRLSVDTLLSVVKRIQTEVTGPYEQVSLKTRQLQNLHSTVQLLRHLLLRVKLTSKLRTQLSVPPESLDLAKAAKMLNDICVIGSEVDFRGIDVAQQDEEFLVNAGKSIRGQAEAILQDGITTRSQAKVGVALQVFFNLDELQQAVESCINKYVAEVAKSLKTALDGKHLGSGSQGKGAAQTAGGLATPGGARALSNPPPGMASSWQNDLFQLVREVMDNLHHHAVAVWHLQRVIAKKRDPLTQVCFLDVLVGAGRPLLTERFWKAVVEAVGEVFSVVAKPAKGGFVRETLSAQYPRLAVLLEGTYEKILQDTTIRGVAPAVQPDDLQDLLQATAPFQASYLATSLSRITDVVLACFSSSTRGPPQASEVQKIIAVMHEELKLAGSSGQLSVQKVGVVGKGLQVLGEKATFMAATGPELRMVGNQASQAQVRNINLTSLLQEVHRSLVSFVSRLPPAASQALSRYLDQLQDVAVEMVAPTMKAMMEMIEGKLLGVHQGILGPDAREEDVVHTSSYMKELGALLTLFRTEYFSKFVPAPSANIPSCIGALVERMAGRTVIFFVRHASLVRPLNQAARLQLAKDIAELQLVVSQQLYPTEQLGVPHKMLRAFRALLFLETDAIPSSPLLADLPLVTVLHHLYARAPAVLQAPHEASGLTPSQYSHWLDQHTLKEALEQIQRKIEAAEKKLETQDEALYYCQLMTNMMKVK